ncbi:uncharacterized protein EDB91DRAFT_885649 [Suillus paluster]|uniref:uncharacterized protein n=1 Tax=Suillus paluster TaxID=48578 RepID=UPI001B85E2F7|nr:uncharacterized protein EDB91DRAFT_885649 [Suillus paluster]KAG1727751.1 hypothetical protein EDB91DRAFT_885649 [Suillus paluster]
MVSTITDLPAELIEAVLIVSAASGDTSSIAALSQTSKLFFDIIYRCPDQHLWREIFLTTFDDPRPALSNLSTISGGHPNFDAHKFDWTQEYTDRISAARYIRHPPPPVPATAPVCSQREVSNVSVVKALLSAITTSTPIRSTPPVSLTILTDVPESNSPFAPMINSPPFPPLLLLLTANYSSMLESVNAKWLQELLEIGLPPELTRTLLARLPIDVQGHAPYQPALTSASHWDGSEVAHLFHKLVCCTGFIPISAPALDLLDLLTPGLSSEPDLATVPGAWPAAQLASPLASSDSPTPDEDETRSLPPLPIPRPPSSLYTAEEQSADARTLARRRVYDMRYLNPARMWGPFQTVQRDTDDSSNQPESSDEEEDRYDDDDDDDEFGMLRESSRRLNLSPPIEPYELVPDYVWLASARMVVEANLREVFRREPEPNALSMGDILPYMRKMHTTCVGGSPGYWNAWVDRPGKGEEGSQDNGKSKQGEVEGWDWAGVSGIWKRCICWLDYRELLVHNLEPQRFLEYGMQEACRIMPLAIRITGYSESPIVPGSTARPLPTIHVEGESIGSDRSLDDLRKVTGTVSMIGDGAIRWSLVSSAAGSSKPEWSSEAVQIGGPGAAVGFLGLWTGARHERPDPLGPFWGWKVV